MSETFENLKGEAERLGTERGWSAATWVEMESLADAIALVEDVDPEVEDRYAPRAPLAHEYGDDPTIAEVLADIAEGAGVPVAEVSWVIEDDLLSAYESAYYEAFRAEVEIMAWKLIEAERLSV